MINAQKEILKSFFNGDTRLIVPFFQRSYVWGKDNWEQFFNNVIGVWKGESSEHFIGTIITKQRESHNLSETKHDLIDGQQRLTTVAVFLKALATTENQQFGRFITSKHLYIELENDERLPRIEHSRVDGKFFLQVLEGDIEEGTTVENGIVKAYQFFLNALADYSESQRREIKDVLLGKIPVVSMLLHSSDDEQIIFDTINSLGVRLTTAELLKNHLFNSAEMHSSYDKLWYPCFEENSELVEFWNREKTAGRVTRTNVELVLYCALIVRTGKEVSFERLYKEYKSYLENAADEDRQSLVRDIVSYAKIYYSFPDENELSHIAYGELENRFFATLLSLENTTIYPLVMYIYRNSTDTDELHKMLQLLETYLVRRKICRLTSKNYNKSFIGIKNALKKSDSCNFTSLKSIIDGYVDETNRMPTDAELENAIRSYSMYNKHAHGILFTLALYQHSDEMADIAKLPRSNYSVEHIMPKKWMTHWPMPEGGEEAVGERNYRILTLGNLTLVTKKLNSKMKNSAWETKRGHLRKHSSLHITTAYIDDEWCDTAIERRSDDLAEIATQVWAV